MKYAPMYGSPYLRPEVLPRPSQFNPPSPPVDTYAGYMYGAIQPRPQARLGAQPAYRRPMGQRPSEREWLGNRPTNPKPLRPVIDVFDPNPKP